MEKMNRKQEENNKRKKWIGMPPFPFILVRESYMWIPRIVISNAPCNNTPNNCKHYTEFRKKRNLGLLVKG